jgi:hypothetical protein
MKKNNLFFKVISSLLFLLFILQNVFLFAETNENKLSEDLSEKDYQDKINGFLLSLNIEECSDTIKPVGVRPVLLNDDFDSVPREFSVSEKINLSSFNGQTITHKTIVLPNESIEYEIYTADNSNESQPNRNNSTEIKLCYSTTQKKAFKFIFFGTANSMFNPSEIGNIYRKSNEFGEFCLVNQPISEKPIGYKYKIYFINNCTACFIRSRDRDVTPLAQYIDKRYTELTKELNSPPAFRKWFAPDKIFSIEAKYISSDSTKVKLIRKDDNKQIEIESSKLSSVDQLYIKRRAEVEDAKSKNAMLKNKADKTETKTK